VDEAARALRVHSRSVLRWFKDGLPRVEDGRPYLIRGCDLAEFLDRRSRKRKAKCRLDDTQSSRANVPSERTPIDDQDELEK
jgi:hypothetical protein